MFARKRVLVAPSYDLATSNRELYGYISILSSEKRDKNNGEISDGKVIDSKFVNQKSYSIWGLFCY